MKPGNRDDMNQTGVLQVPFPLNDYMIFQKKKYFNNNGKQWIKIDTETWTKNTI